ncbi:MAG: SEC-C metal-binding domain-containing protein [candidate division KSB1 bacterium]|nr:SEC-C metal-binding domain-containing protein [candidate division KSB1 bacterium]MDZ7318778.1 SEC-C metal-binding domain-containing protein [candidate division KSB1 bacterium]MDZ7341474.1 SEC-C metal-binding domain-containing protein [candidate division KSB1 bacterium]
MNIRDLPTLEPDLDKLSQDLSDLCQQYHIVRFEPQDIIELVQDGEEIDWIIGQLQQDNSALDASRFKDVLSAIAAIAAPPKEEMLEEQPPEIEAPAPAPMEEAPALDLSQVDLSALESELEAMTGMKLPAGVDLNQIKQIMQSPQGAFLADFGLFCQEQGVDMAAVTDAKELETLNERWLATPRAAFGGKTPAEVRQNDPSLFSFKKVETYRRTEPRIGRNDPCPCGSGKKYKKCCGIGK